MVPKLADFGLSVSSQRLIWRPPVAVGTMRYMAPECLMRSPEPLRIPQAIDVYAFGFVLHEVAHMGVGAGAAAAGAEGRERRRGDAELQKSSESCSARTDATNSPNISQTLLRTRSSFEMATAPHVAAPLRQLIVACCAHAPEARPTFAFLRENLMAVAQAGNAADVWYIAPPAEQQP